MRTETKQAAELNVGEVIEMTIIVRARVTEVRKGTHDPSVIHVYGEMIDHDNPLYHAYNDITPVFVEVGE